MLISYRHRLFSIEKCHTKTFSEDEFYKFLTKFIENPLIKDSKDQGVLLGLLEQKTPFLVLDFDKNTPIKDFEDIFKDYDYYLYTSFSHNDEYHKYRVYLPISHPWSKEWVGNYLKAYSGSYGVFKELNIDISTFDPYREFYLPCHKEYSSYYYKINLTGEKFDTSPTSELFKEVNEYRKKISKKREIKEITTTEKKSLKYIEEMIIKKDINNRGYTNDINYFLFITGLKITDCGYSWEEAKDILLKFATNDLTIENIVKMGTPNKFQKENLK